MELRQGRAHFDEEEIAAFAPLWLAISSDEPRLRDQRRDLARKLLTADEVALVKGKDPLLHELEPFSSHIKKKAAVVNPRLTDIDLIHFTFFVLHVDESVLDRMRDGVRS